MSLRAQLNTVASLLEQGAAESAVRMLRSAWEPELPPDDLVPLYCIWIRALCETGDLDHALVLAKRAADEFPDEVDIMVALGNVHDMRSELEPARAAFEHAIRLDPGGALQHYNLGAVLERLDREDAAETCYREAIAVDRDLPGMFEAIAALGALLRRHGRLDEASELYEGYLEEDPINAEILVEHGICLSDLDRFEEACERFEFALSVEADHPGALYNLAITLYRMGHHPRAVEYMERAYQVDRGAPLTLAVLGGWYLATPDRNLDEALTLLYGALDRLMELDRCEAVGSGYASIVVEEVFECLWQHERRTEAREVARLAGQRDWITSHMLDTLNEADHGADGQAVSHVTAFTVVARAEAREIPAHWPADARGYTTGLMVLATDEDEARKLTLEYLRAIDNHPGVRFHVDAVRPNHASSTGATDGIPGGQPRARGVFGVSSSRAYFRNSGGSSRTV